MPGVNVNWSESAPANGDNAGLGAQEIRSLKTSVRNAMDAEHLFSSTGGAGTGAHRQGSARAFYGAESTVSSADTDGRLMVSSNRSRLFHVGSTGTMYLGSATGLSVASSVLGATILGALPQTHYWAIEDWFGTTGSSGSVTQPFSAFSGVPLSMAWYSAVAPTEMVAVHAAVIGNSSVTVFGFKSSGAANVTFKGFSIGSRVLG